MAIGIGVVHTFGRRQKGGSGGGFTGGIVKPAQATAFATAVDPTVTIGANEFVTAGAAAAMAAALDPSIVADTIASPEGATGAATAVDPTVIGTIELAPAAAIGAATALDPTVLGDQVISPAVATAIATAFGPTLPGLTVPAIEYDGFQSQLFKAGGFVGASDGAEISYAEFWLPAVDGVEMVLASGDGTVPWVVLRNSDNEYEFIGGTAGAVFHVVTGPVLVAVGRVLVLATATGTTASLTVTDAAGTEVGVNTPGSATNLDFTADTRFGSWDGATGMQQGTVHQKWLDFSYIGAANDVDVIEQFIDTTTHALRNPGTDGSNPLDGDHTPIACFKDAASSHHVNSGSGGDADTGPGGSGMFFAGVSPGDYAEDFSPGSDVIVSPAAAIAAAVTIDPLIEGNTFVSPAAAIAAVTAIDPTVDVGGSVPTIVAGSIVHSGFGTTSNANRTYLADYVAGAGADRKVIALFACQDSAVSPGFDACTWGGVPLIDAGFVYWDGAANDVDVQAFYLDEADFPAPGTNTLEGDSAGTEHYALTIFTVQDALPGPFRDDDGGTGGDTSPSDRSLTVSHIGSLILTVLGIGDEITDTALTGTGHTLVDTLDGSGELIIIGEVENAASGAHTLGFTFTDSAWSGRSLAIAPIGSYTPFEMTHPLSTQFSTSTTAHAVTMPATVDAGDLLVVGIGLFGGASNPAISTPTDWDQKSHSVNGTGRLGIYVKEADGTEGGGTVDFVTDNAATGAALCYRIKAGDWSGSTADIEAGTPSTGTNSNSVNPPAVTPSWASGGDRWLAMIFIMQKDDDVRMTSKPAGYYGRYSVVSGAGANAGASISSTWKQVDGTTDDPGTHGFSAQDDYVANTIAIRKAA